MLVKTKEGYRSDYRYFFSSTVTDKQKKQLSHVAGDYSDEGKVFAGFFGGGFATIMGTVGDIISTFDRYDTVITPGSVVLSLIGYSVIGMTTNHVLRPRRARKLLNKIDSREMCIAFTADYYSKSQPLNSYACDSLDKALGNSISLRELIFEKSVNRHDDLEEYKKYITENPHDELFPKLKPTIDLYLQATAQADIGLVKAEGKASEGKVRATKKLVDERATEAATAIKEIISSHKAGQQFKANTELEMADFALDQIVIPPHTSMGYLPS